MDTFFEPFVGKDYRRGGIFGKRIMVLGESHYCDEGCADCGEVGRHGECAAFTNNVVGHYLDEQQPRLRWMNTFLKFERSLVGHEKDRAERRQIWQSVLFCNYLQVAMGGPRQAGKGEEYDHASRAFYKVIDHYRPQYILVWGRRLWNYLPGDERWRQEAPIIIDGHEVSAGSYALAGGGRARAMAVHHPSVGYAWDRWHRAIIAFLA